MLEHFWLFWPFVVYRGLIGLLLLVGAATTSPAPPTGVGLLTKP